MFCFVQFGKTYIIKELGKNEFEDMGCVGVSNLPRFEKTKNELEKIGVILK